MDDFFSIFIIANRLPIFRTIIASKYVLLLITTLLKYAYACVHNVRYICNVIKICLTLMVSKYAQFPSDVIYKMQCDDVNTCHFQKVSFFSKSIATGDVCMRANVKQYEIKAEENYALNHKLSRQACLRFFIAPQ